MNKKLLSLVAASLLLASTQVKANGTPPPADVDDSFKLTGAVEVGMGFQSDSNNANGGSIGGLPDFTNTTNVGNSDGESYLRFFVNEVELDGDKSFGDNIRLRFDLDFKGLTDTDNAEVSIEQAYVTFGISSAEVSIGRFNAPIGVEHVDVRNNWLISYAAPFRYLTPVNLTGVKIWIPFNDTVDLQIAVANSLNQSIGVVGAAEFQDNIIPSALVRLGFKWGEESRQSTVGITGAVGPEFNGATAGLHNEDSDLDILADIDAVIAFSDTFSLAAEGTFRMSQARTSGLDNAMAVAALLAFNYAPTEVWDFTLRGHALIDLTNFSYGVESDVASTTGAEWNAIDGVGFEGNIIGVTLGMGYVITEDAKFKLEGRFDSTMPDNDAFDTGSAFSVLGHFAYTF